MKKLISIGISLFFAFHLMAQPNPQTKKITETFFKEVDSLKNVTPALLKAKGFTNYEELIGFLNEIKQQFPDFVKLEFIGESQKGNAIPIIHISNPKASNDKIKVWMQGGIHGNEPASSEGLLYLIHALLHNKENHYLLDKIELKMIPMANIDGYLKQDRYAANGLDLNRDQTKLMAPESVLLKQAFSDFSPAVGLDFHEYNPYRKDFSKLGSFGITSAYDVMFLYSGNLNVAKNIREITDKLFVAEARKCMDTHGLKHHDYMSTDDYHGAIVFNLGSQSARSSATSYALTQTVSTLIEVRGVGIGRTSFKRRIATTYLIGMSYLKTAYNNDVLVKNEIQKAKQPIDIVVTSQRSTYKKEIEVIDLDAESLINLEVTIRDAMLSEPKLVRKQPKAYLIDKSKAHLIDKLKVLGIKVETMNENQTLEVETFQISKYESDGLPYEKMKMQEVSAQLITKKIDFEIGTFMISTNQKNASLLTETLEPEAPNSFVSFGVLTTELNQELPIYRLPSTY